MNETTFWTGVFKMEGNSDFLWLPFKAFVSVEDVPSMEHAPLRYASLHSGWEGKHPRMLLVIG